MTAMFKLGVFSLALLLIGLMVGVVIGATGRIVLSREGHVVNVHAGAGARECLVDWEIEKGFGPRPSAFLDGTSRLACKESAAPSSTFAIVCACP